MVACALSPLSTSGTRRYPSMITPYLLLGDAEDAGNTRVLKALGVTHVLNAAGSLAPPPGHTTAFMYLHLPLEDTPGQSLEAALVEAVAFIGVARECGGLVLVHCAMGISRSVSCALAFLTHPGGGNLPLAAAATLVMARRPIAMPNSGFRTQLALWEVECRGRSSVAVLEGVSAMWDVREWRTHPVRLREVAVKEGEAEEREKLGWWGRWWGGDAAGKGGGGTKGKGVAPTLPSSSASSIYSSRSTSSSTR